MGPSKRATVSDADETTTAQPVPGVSYAKAAVKPASSMTPKHGETYADAIKEAPPENVGDVDAKSKRAGSDSGSGGKKKKKKRKSIAEHDSEDAAREENEKENAALLKKQERIDREAKERDDELRRKTGEEVVYGGKKKKMEMEREKVEREEEEERKRHDKEERKRHEKHEREEKLKREKQEREEQERELRLEKEELKRKEKKGQVSRAEKEHRLDEIHEYQQKESGGIGSPEKTGEELPSEKDEEERSDKEVEEILKKPTLVSARPRIRWAPLRIPLHRRIEMAAVVWHACAMGILLSFFWFLLAIPLTWVLLLPYLVYVLFSNTHADGTVPYKKRSTFIRRLPIWRFYADYFPLRLHRTQELPAHQNYIFAYHPHGIISHGAFGNFATDATGFADLFPGITNTLLTLDSNFRIPIYREYLLSLGLASVSRRSCEALLRGEGEPKKYAPRSLWKPRTWIFPPALDTKPAPGGRAITIVIGGARESLEALPGRMRLVVKRRRGFLKIAMKEDAGVVPVLSFGENDLYDQVIPSERSLIHRFQIAVKKSLGFTLPLFHARGVFNYDVGIMPYRKEVNVVVGRPIFPEKNLNPRDEDIDKLQERYIAELQRLWNEYKDRFAKNRLPGAEGEMVFVE